MSLSCPVLNDIILKEINEIKKNIKNLEEIKTNNSGIDIDKYLSEKYRIQDNEIEKLKNTVDVYKSESYNFAELNEKVDNIVNCISKNDSIRLGEKINYLDNKITLISNNLSTLTDKYNKSSDNNNSNIYQNNIDILNNKITELSSTIIKMNIEINKITTNYNNLFKRVEYLEKRNYKRTYTKNNNYNYYSKDQVQKDLELKNNIEDGWTTVTNKKRNKRF